MSIERRSSWFISLCCAALTWGGAAYAQAPTAPQAEINMTLDQARNIGVAALEQGNPTLALQIGYGLLQADPNDAFAHYLIASAFRQQARPAAARRAAALAYRHAGTTPEKFQAAQLAARISVEEQRFTRAQVWLRRSLIHAPDPAFLPRIEEDYRRVRALDPLQLRFSFSIAPSSNVNNGSDSPYALIEGVPVIGIFDGLSQALSGVTAAADLALGYRLHRTQSSETRALARLYSSRVWLDNSSLALANSFPGADVSNEDFAFSSAEAGLRHAVRPDGMDGRGLISADLVAGRSWYGGSPYQRFGRLGLSGGLSLTPATTLSVGAEMERRSFETSANRPIESLALRGTLAHGLDNGDRISLSLSWRDSQSDTRNAVNTRTAAYLQYAMAAPIGPARLSFALGAATSDFPDYAVGFIVVPGGRLDETVFGSVEMLFEAFDYAGFVPSMTVRAQKTRSNVSRFEASEIAVSFGVRSRF